MTKNNIRQRIYESLKDQSQITISYQRDCKTAEAVGIIRQVTDEYVIIKQVYEGLSCLTLIWFDNIYEVR